MTFFGVFWLKRNWIGFRGEDYICLDLSWGRTILWLLFADYLLGFHLGVYVTDMANV